MKSRDGKLIAYCGNAVEKEQSPRLLFHKFDPTQRSLTRSVSQPVSDLWICRDPLQVLVAVENGVAPDRVVSVLTDGMTPA